MNNFDTYQTKYEKHIRELDFRIADKYEKVDQVSWFNQCTNKVYNYYQYSNIFGWSMYSAECTENNIVTKWQTQKASDDTPILQPYDFEELSSKAFGKPKVKNVNETYDNIVVDKYEVSYASPEERGALLVEARKIINYLIEIGDIKLAGASSEELLSSNFQGLIGKELKFQVLNNIETILADFSLASSFFVSSFEANISEEGFLEWYIIGKFDEK